MPLHDDTVQPHVTTIDYQGRRYSVSCRIAFDGIEYVGRLWFADDAWDDTGIPDRGARSALSPRPRREAPLHRAPQSDGRSALEDPLPEPGGDLDARRPPRHGRR